MFEELVELLNNTGAKRRYEVFLDAMTQFGAFLREQAELRIFVDGSRGMGHQASSVRVMMRLIEKFYFRNRIRIVYREGDVDDPTVQKLAVLISGFDPENPGNDIKVFGATVSALPWPQRNTLQDVVNLGFAGGAGPDDELEQLNLATELKTHRFLRLQPYLWLADQLIEAYKTKPSDSINLDEVFGTTFVRRAYWIEYPGVLPDEWEWYETHGSLEMQLHTKLAHTLVDNIGAIHLCPVYGVREHTETGQFPDETLAQISIAVECAARGQNPYAGPAVIVSLDNDISDESFLALQRIWNGGYSNNERRFQQQAQQAIYEILTNRSPDPKAAKEFADSVAGLTRNADKRIEFLAQGQFESEMFLWRNLSPEQLATNLGLLQERGRGVAVFQLGKLPQVIFDKMYSIATLPTFFEGQGTANLALCLGNPYLHIPRPKQTEDEIQLNTYPSNTLQVPNAEQISDAIAAVARSVTAGFTDIDNSFRTSALGISNFIKGVFVGTVPEAVKYFEGMRAFYAAESNDKLLVAIAYLAYATKIVKTDSLQLMARADVDAVPRNLDELWVALNANLSGATLNFIPGTFPSGNIYAYYKSVAPGGVAIDSVELRAERDNDGKITRITTSGGRTSAFGFPMLAELEFTALYEAIVSRGRYASSEPWPLAGVPWIVLDNGGFELTIYETDYPASGKIFATVRDVGLTVTLEYPTPEDAWLIQFRTAQPVGVEMMFNIAGGVNLLRVLPPPLLALGGFGALGFDLLFRPIKRGLDSVQVYLGTNQPWSIVEGRLEVTRILIAIAVLNPASRTRKTTAEITGDITIGSGPTAALISISAALPEMQFRGALVGGVLRLEDILAIFLPGVPLDLSAVPKITDFLFVYAPNTGNYSVSCNLNVGWTISIPGIADIELRELAFSVEKLLAGPTGGISAIFLVGESTEGPPLTIELSASYLGSTTGWQFAGRQTAGTISLAALVSRFLPSGWQFGEDYNIRDVAFTIAPTPSKYSFFGATDGFWSVPFIPSLQIAGDLSLNYSGTPAGLFSGRISARIQYYFIDLTVYYAFGTTSEWGFTWGILSGVVAQNAKQEWVGTLKLGTFSLGEMVETMVSWATGSAFSLAAPWTFLNAITFSGIELQFNFTTNQVRLSLALNIELGFASLTKISITYDPTNRTGLGNGSTPPVAIELEGRFFWQVGEEQKPLAWDATRPETTPAPPGNGNQYLDLRLLALGQHVTIAGLTQANTVQKAVELIATMKEPEPGKIPDVRFDPESAWFIGADFGVLRFGEGTKP